MNGMPGAWLCQSVEPHEYARLRQGYGDQLGHTYSWTSRIAQARNLRAGDIIAIWDKAGMLGMSVIEHIRQGRRFDQVFRCPREACRRIEIRQLSDGRYRCTRCHYEFPQAQLNEEAVEVETFEAEYSAAWTPIAGVGAAQCRQMARNPRSQHSIRPLDPDRLQRFLQRRGGALYRRVAGRAEPLQGGHRQQVVRARIGQGEFRRRLLVRFDAKCALAGKCHPSALHAAHLYRYAGLGVHHDDGGLLLRADLHSLFDAGLIRIDPNNGWSIWCAAELRGYPDVYALHGRNVRVRLTARHKSWLRLHWELGEGPPPA